MKKRLITASLIALCATGANAAVSVDIGINSPGYYAPAPVPVYEPVYINDRHRNYDWAYWNHQKELREAEQRRIEWERDHRGRGNAYGHDNDHGKGHGKKGNH